MSFTWLRRLGRKRKFVTEQTVADYAATLPTVVVEGELEPSPPGTFGKFTDRRVDVEAPICVACDKAIKNEPPHIEMDGKPRHNACAMHERFGCLGDSPEATHCAVCGAQLVRAEA
jgi:hypothetical protein